MNYRDPFELMTFRDKNDGIIAFSIKEPPVFKNFLVDDIDGVVWMKGTDSVGESVIVGFPYESTQYFTL
jgi:hypothetical protein